MYKNEKITIPRPSFTYKKERNNFNQPSSGKESSLDSKITTAKETSTANKNKKKVSFDLNKNITHRI